MEGREEKEKVRKADERKKVNEKDRGISSLLSLADQGGSCNSGPLLPRAVTAVAGERPKAVTLL